MNLIVAADKNWAIGNRGRLLVTIPEDQKLFRQETLGKVIVMGRKTMESLPEARPFRDVPMWSSQGTGIIKKGSDSGPRDGRGPFLFKTVSRRRCLYHRRRGDLPPVPSLLPDGSCDQDRLCL